MEKNLNDFSPEEAAVIEQAIICLGHSYVFRDQKKGDKIYNLAEQFREIREKKFDDIQIGVNQFVKLSDG